MKHFDEMQDNFADALRSSADELGKAGFDVAKDMCSKILRIG